MNPFADPSPRIKSLFIMRLLRVFVVEDVTASVPAFDAKPAVVLANGSTANIDSAIAEVLLGVLEARNRDLGVTFRCCSSL